MNLYECPRVDDAAGYVLGAMPDGEAESYRHHVTQCVECEAKVDELNFVSHALLSAVPQLSAPPEIRNRVMAVVRAEAELLAAAGAGADRPPRAEPRRLRWGFARLRPVTAGALATVLLVLGLGTGMILRGGGSCSTRTGAVTSGAGPNARGDLKICDGKASLQLAAITSAPAGRIFVMWIKKDGQEPRPVGVPFQVRNHKASVDIGRLPAHVQVLLTHEEMPGDTAVPSIDPIVTIRT